MWNNIAVSFHTIDTTAHAGVKYKKAEGKITFKPGDGEAELQVLLQRRRHATRGPDGLLKGAVQGALQGTLKLHSKEPLNVSYIYIYLYLH